MLDYSIPRSLGDINSCLCLRCPWFVRGRTRFIRRLESRMATRTPTATTATRDPRPRRAAQAASSTHAARRGADLARIETPKLAHIVAARLRRRIITGELPPGSSLPREADLMAQFGVARPSLREALRVLEAEAL